jgi:hypothetical protein
MATFPAFRGAMPAGEDFFMTLLSQTSHAGDSQAIFVDASEALRSQPEPVVQRDARRVTLSPKYADGQREVDVSY